MKIQSGVSVSVFRYPSGSCFDFASAALRYGVLVRTVVDFSFIDQAFLDEGVEIWVKASVVDF